MTALNESSATKIAKLFRSLNSDFDGEVLSVVAAMKRLFANEGLSFHDIATVIESCNGMIEERKYSDADAQVIFERGVAKGLAEKQAGSTDFFDGDQPRWYEIAAHCRQHDSVRRLSAWEQEFIADIAGKVLGIEPSPKQARVILKIFVKLGGQLGPNVQAAYF